MLCGHIARVTLSNIDMEDTAYSLSPFDTINVSVSLQKSVENYGIIYPPVIKEKLADSFQIVTGRKRLHIAREVLSCRAIDCIILSGEIPETDIFGLILEENLLSSSLSPVEKAVFFKKVLLIIDEQEAAKEYLPRMGLSPHPFHIKRFNSMLDLEEQIVESIHEGRLNESVAFELCKLSFTDRLSLYEVVNQLQLSVGKQKKLFNSCKELSMRLNISITDLLSGSEVCEILEHEEANQPQKATNIMNWLAKKCNPRLKEAENSFSQFTKSLKLPSSVHLSHAPSFEKDELQLTINFKNRDHLAKTWKKVKSDI